MTRRGVRLYRSGALVRASTLPPALIIDASLAVCVLGGKAPTEPLEQIGALSLGLFFTLLALRAARIGVWLTPDTLISKGWLRTRRYDRRDIADCITELYWGYFDRTGTGLFRQLSLSIREDVCFTLSGTMAWSRTSLAQATLINQWLADGHVGKRPPGRGQGSSATRRKGPGRHRSAELKPLDRSAPSTVSTSLAEVLGRWAREWGARSG